jgi:hypothetical protein
MKTMGASTWLVLAVAGLAIAASSAGVFFRDGAAPITFVTLHGETVELHGQWPYRNDTSVQASIQRGTDAMTLFVSVPLLLVALLLGRRGSLRARLALAGMLSYFVYNAASMALGLAYNELLLLYIAYLSAASFAFLGVLSTIDTRAVASAVAPGAPRRGIAAFMFVAGGAVGALWLSIVVGALVRGVAPDHLDSYTTVPVFVFDLAFVIPATLLAGVLVLRGAGRGYVLAAVMLILYALVGIMALVQTIATVSDGIVIGIAEFSTFVAPFLLMSIVAAWLVSALLRRLDGQSAALRTSDAMGHRPASSG